MKRKNIVLTAIFFFLYVSNYIVIRQSNLAVWGCEDTPKNSCSYVNFPFNGFNKLYSPLIVADKKLTGTNFYIIEK